MREHPNLTKLNAWVDAKRGFAVEKAHPQAYLDDWAAWLNRQLDQLALAFPPKHLIGLTAFDLANARDRLTAPLRADADRDPLPKIPLLEPVTAEVVTFGGAA